MSNGPRPVLFYDGDCGFCRIWVARLRRADRYSRLDYLPSAERDSRPDLPTLDDAQVARAIHLVTPDGRVLSGAQTAPVILRLLPGWRLAAPLFRVPGVQWLADRVYGWVAARRHRLGCGPRGCGVGEEGLR